MTKAESDTVFHRDFLGAHRYTTCGGIVRPAGSFPRLRLHRVLTQRPEMRWRYAC